MKGICSKSWRSVFIFFITCSFFFPPQCLFSIAVRVVPGYEQVSAAEPQPKTLVVIGDDQGLFMKRLLTYSFLEKGIETM